MILEDRALKEVIVHKARDVLRVVNLEHLQTKLVSQSASFVVQVIIVMVIHLSAINHALKDIIVRNGRSMQRNSLAHVDILTTSHVVLISGTLISGTLISIM